MKQRILVAVVGVPLLLLVLVWAPDWATMALVMLLCGLLLKKFKWNWVNDYALPISLVLGMASAIPITAWLG